MNEVNIGNVTVGKDKPAYFIAEIGINHNGDINTAKKLIEVAANAGCSAVKFQKRTPDLCVPESQHDLVRETPWGLMTYLEYRYKVEFGLQEYREIDEFCKSLGINWMASVWDIESVDFISQFDIPAIKIPSAKLTDDALLNYIRRQKRTVILSTGMSTLEQVDQAVSVLGRENMILLHACSAYPADYSDLNLNLIPYLANRYEVPVGYSGHETGLASTVAAVALGACVVERHITLDRAMWGSDHAASLEPTGLTRLMRDIRLVETSMGTAQKRILHSEEPVLKKLRNL